ncbi:hypothetical protein [Ostreibacterium oceani]|uniref:Uncharacterized protein n=1 Tax=Ostreibacterium oceani TaxID=2654998 RepID=A0A6N7EUS1_9GAMM|nr:hypothetical protein [Ostreibacterium oceani]MPV86202.1 hypothetical protein [Ostreibacterium oceani]
MLKIEKITYLKVGYFLLPTAVFLYDFIYVTDEFRFVFAALISIFLALPLGFIAAKGIEDYFYDLKTLETMLENLSFGHDMAQTIAEPIIGFVFVSIIMCIGYVQWFIIVPKLWRAIFRLRFWPFNVINHESILVRIGAVIFVYITSFVSFYIAVAIFYW